MEKNGNSGISREQFNQFILGLVVCDEGVKNLVKVNKEPFLYDPTDYGQEGRPRYIVSTNGTTNEQIAVLKKFIAEEADEAAEQELQEALNKAGLTLSIWVNDGVQPDYVPMKGEMIHAIIGYVPTRDSGEQLRITSFSQLHVGKTRKAFTREAAAVASIVK